MDLAKTRNKRVVKLSDRRTLSGNSTRALRKVLKEVSEGLATNIVVSSVRRDGSIYTFADGEDPIRQLGALKVLECDIIKEQLKPVL